MKKNHQKILILSITISALTLIYLFRPSIWQERIETYLNNQLNDSGWILKNSVFSGHLFTQVSSNDIILTKPDGSIVQFPSINARIKIVPLLLGRINLNQLTVSNATIKPSFDFQGDKTETSMIVFDPNSFPVNIKNLYIDGSFIVPFEDSTRSVDFLLNGEISNKDENINLYLKQFDFFSPSMDFEVNTKGLKGFFNKNKFSLDFNSASINNISLSGYLEYSFFDTSSILAQIELNDYKIPESIFSQLPLQPNLSKLSAVFNFKSNLTDYIGDLQIENDLGLKMQGSFELKSDSGYVRLNKLDLEGNEASLSLNGLIEEAGRFNGIVKLDNLDFSEWILNSQKTGISGYLLLDGSFQEMLITSLDVNADVSESIRFNKEPSSFSGGISYSESILKIFNPVTLSIGRSLVTIQGSADYKKKILDFNVDLTEASSSLINYFWSDTLSSGNATGAMKIDGTFDQTSLNADLIISNFIYNDISLSNFELYAQLNDLRNNRNGVIKTKFSDGEWNDFFVQSGNGQFLLNNNEVGITSFEVRNNSDFMQLNGSYIPDSLLIIDKFQLAYQNHFLINPSQLILNLSNEKLSISPFELHVDDGVIQGSFETNPFVGKIKFSNVTSDLLPLLKLKGSEKISGSLFGEINFPRNINSERIIFDFSIKEGFLVNQPFNDLRFDVFYQDGILSIDTLLLKHESISSFFISGNIPFPFDKSKSQPTEFFSEYKNIDLSFISDISNNYLSRIKGQFTGSFNIAGNTFDTEYYLSGKIQNAFWGKLPLGTVNGEGLYKNKKLIFENFSSKIDKNRITGNAKIPIDIDFVSKSRKISPNAEIEFNSKGSLRSAEFISAYVSEVDSIIGNIDINFSIKGPRKSLKRNGNINLSSASIYTVLMDEPVKDIIAQAELVNNKMTIKSFKGSVNNSAGRKKERNNLNISGGIDLAKFFEPRYAINASGKNIFYRSLNQDIESYADLEVFIVGKDTIDISGTINAKNGAIYKEFTGSEPSVKSDEQGRVLTNYNIRFPIEDSFAIRNSQIDAKISGELGMSKLFSDEWNYSGEIEFLEGQIYYYLGDVFENLKGSMVFDGQGFNPFLEVSASTKIGDSEILLGVFGPLDNPEWRFDSDKGYSESDILQLLTFNTRVSEEGFSTEGLGTQAQTILGAYLERQLEKNFIKTTGLKSSGIIQDVQISGTSELLNPNQGEEFSINARLNQNFSLSYKRSFSLEAAYKNKVGVEYKLNPNFSVIGNVDESGQVQMKFRVRRVY
mgnify:CR=1 FL=1